MFYSTVGETKTRAKQLTLQVITNEWPGRDNLWECFVPMHALPSFLFSIPGWSPECWLLSSLPPGFQALSYSSLRFLMKFQPKPHLSLGQDLRLLQKVSLQFWQMDMPTSLAGVSYHPHEELANIPESWPQPRTIMIESLGMRWGHLCL